HQAPQRTTGPDPVISETGTGLDGDGGGGVGVVDAVTRGLVHGQHQVDLGVWVPRTVPRPLTRGIGASGPTSRSPSAARLDRRGTRSRRSNPSSLPLDEGHYRHNNDATRVELH